MESLVWWEREVLFHAGKLILKGGETEDERTEHFLTTPDVWL